jgi:hypothetical protein
MRENHALLRGAGQRRRIASLNIQHRTSDIQHPVPDDSTRRKGRRKSNRISLPDQEWGSAGGLWYQGMSRVVPGCPQTSPRAAGEGSCIRDAYGGHGTLNLEPRTLNLEQPDKAIPSHPQAPLRPSTSQPLGTLKPPSGHPQAPTRLPSGYPEVTGARELGEPVAPITLPGSVFEPLLVRGFGVGVGSGFQRLREAASSKTANMGRKLSTRKPS